MQGKLFVPEAPEFRLRDYQRQAVESTWAWLRDRSDNPCIVIPTGGGKTPVIAEICRQAVEEWGGRVLILAHVKELLEQTCEKLHLVFPSVEYGVYSAGMRRRDTEHQVIVAGIQSVYKRACELDAFDLILVDECHLIPPSGDGMYRTFFETTKKVNPETRLIGLTATPYRMKTGALIGPQELLNGICFEIGVRDLIDQGYLCELRGKASATKVDTARFAVLGGEFVASDMERVYNVPAVVESACREIVQYAEGRKGILVFTSGVDHCEAVALELVRRTGERVEVVTGETPLLERAAIINGFKAGDFRYLVNVNVLTTGFDASHIDMIALLRATLSPGLYYQMLGRGFRLHSGKTDCLVLDFGSNVVRHGPVDVLNHSQQRRTPKRDDDGELCRECTKCRSFSPIDQPQCIDCGERFPMFWNECPQCGEFFLKTERACPCGWEPPEPPPRQINHDGEAAEAEPLSGQVTFDGWVPVKDITYDVHVKKNAPPGAPRTLRVDYWYGIADKISEWVCLEHDDWPRRKACKWWYDRTKSLQAPERVEDAVAIADSGGLAFAHEIRIQEKHGEPFPRVIGWKLGPVPDPPTDPLEVMPATEDVYDDLPF